MFLRSLGSAIFLPVAQNVFLSRLISTLANIPDTGAHAVLNGGATKLRHLATGDDLKTLLSDYNTAIVDASYMVVASCALTIIERLLVEWRSLKSHTTKQAGKTSTLNESAETKKYIRSNPSKPLDP